MKKIKAGIVGGAGYTGGETIRLLVNHPHVNIDFIHSRSHAGNPVASIHQDLTGETDLIFTDVLKEVDVLFLCLGHGESKKLLEQNTIPRSTRIIDLSQDFRLHEEFAGRKFVYGLPEVNKEHIQGASNIANPGCFATAIQLSLLPLAKAGVLNEVFTTGITGSTGAGQKLQDTTHFTWRANNISAYKTLTHQHLDEIYKTIKHVQSGFTSSIHFVPWRGDFTRGIFTSSVLHTTASLSELKALFEEYYSSHPFTIVAEGDVHLKQVVNTNKCALALEQQGNTVVVHAAIDNLLKGASGQAVQNMNLMFGFDETTGLRLKATAF